MISQLEVLMKEIIDSINKEEIVKKIDFERYKKHLLKYVKKVNQEIVKEIYDVMIFETVYINILLVIIEEIIKYKFKIKVGHDIILRKIDENGIFSNYELEEKYITKTRQLLTDKRRINLGFFTDFYEKSIHKQHKKILGQFYTPQTIVNEMIKNVRLSEKMKILDPACGAGIFLTEIIEKYSKKNQAEEVIRFIKNNLYANDINPFAIIMTKINIIIKVINILENRNVICQFFEEETILNNIKLGDTLGIDKDSVEYDLIIGNPPFFKMTKKQIELYYNSSQDITYGQTNIYEMFVNWAIRNVKKDGNIKYIIPQSFKSGLYFKNLRKEISKYYITCIINIHNTKNIFCGVDQAVLIINIKKVSPTNKKTEIKTYDVIKNDFTNQYFIENDKIFNKKNDSYEINIANSEMEYNMIDKIKRNKNIKTLSELGYKFSNGLFVWNQNKNIINNEPNNIPIIYGDYIQKEKFDFNTLLRNQEKKQFCKPSEKSDRLILSGQRLIIQRTSTFTQKNRLNAAMIEKDFLKKYHYYLLENHVNYLTWNNKKEMIEEKKLYFFWAIVNSDLINWIFKIKSGNTQISSTELNLLPICPYEEKIYELAKEYRNTMDKKSREELQSQIYRSYGLNKEEIEVVIRR